MVGVGLNRYYDRTAIAYFILGFVFFLLFMMLLISRWLEGITSLDQDSLPQYALTFLGGIGFIIAGYYKRKRSNTSYKRMLLNGNEKDLLTASRLLIVPHVHWLREFELFAMDGTSVASVREDVHGWKRITTLLMHLMGLRPFLKKKLIVENGRGLMFYMDKKAGIHEIYRIYDAKGCQRATFKMNVFNPLRQYAVIKDTDGHVLGENDGGFSGVHFKVKDTDGETVVNLKHKGIPMEALEMFAGTHGDIIDINQEALDGKDKIAFILAPIIVQLHFRK